LPRIQQQQQQQLQDLPASFNLYNQNGGVSQSPMCGQGIITKLLLRGGKNNNKTKKLGSLTVLHAGSTTLCMSPLTSPTGDNNNNTNNNTNNYNTNSSSLKILNKFKQQHTFYEHMTASSMEMDTESCSESISGDENNNNNNNIKNISNNVSNNVSNNDTTDATMENVEVVDAEFVAQFDPVSAVQETTHTGDENSQTNDTTNTSSGGSTTSTTTFNLQKPNRNSSNSNSSNHPFQHTQWRTSLPAVVEESSMDSFSQASSMSNSQQQQQQQQQQWKNIPSILTSSHDHDDDEDDDDDDDDDENDPLRFTGGDIMLLDNQDAITTVEFDPSVFRQQQPQYYHSKNIQAESVSTSSQSNTSRHSRTKEILAFLKNPGTSLKEKKIAEQQRMREAIDQRIQQAMKEQLYRSEQREMEYEQGMTTTTTTPTPMIMTHTHDSTTAIATSQDRQQQPKLDILDAAAAYPSVGDRLVSVMSDDDADVDANVDADADVDANETADAEDSCNIEDANGNSQQLVAAKGTALMEKPVSMQQLLVEQQATLKEMSLQNYQYRRELSECQDLFGKWKLERSQQQTTIDELARQKEAFATEAKFLRSELSAIRETLAAFQKQQQQQQQKSVSTEPHEETKKEANSSSSNKNEMSSGDKKTGQDISTPRNTRCSSVEVAIKDEEDHIPDPPPTPPSIATSKDNITTQVQFASPTNWENKQEHCATAPDRSSNSKSESSKQVKFAKSENFEEKKRLQFQEPHNETKEAQLTRTNKLDQRDQTPLPARAPTGPETTQDFHSPFKPANKLPPPPPPPPPQQPQQKQKQQQPQQKQQQQLNKLSNSADKANQQQQEQQYRSSGPSVEAARQLFESPTGSISKPKFFWDIGHTSDDDKPMTAVGRMKAQNSFISGNPYVSPIKQCSAKKIQKQPQQSPLGSPIKRDSTRKLQSQQLLASPINNDTATSTQLQFRHVLESSINEDLTKEVQSQQQLVSGLKASPSGRDSSSEKRMERSVNFHDPPLDNTWTLFPNNVLNERPSSLVQSPPQQQQPSSKQPPNENLVKEIARQYGKTSARASTPRAKKALRNQKEPMSPGSPSLSQQRSLFTPRGGGGGGGGGGNGDDLGARRGRTFDRISTPPTRTTFNREQQRDSGAYKQRLESIQKNRQERMQNSMMTSPEVIVESSQ